MVNQIAGNAESNLGAAGGEMLLSVPVIVSGDPLTQVVKSSAEPECVAMETRAETLSVGMWDA